MHVCVRVRVRVRVRAQGTRRAGVEGAVYTYWSEVGGGGHSMSDLWGLRDEIVRRGFRYCSYDPPGTGYSSPAVSGTGVNNVSGRGSNAGDVSADRGGYITDLVMDAMGEKGPFVLMGSMDGVSG